MLKEFQMSLGKEYFKLGTRKKHEDIKKTACHCEFECHSNSYFEFNVLDY